MADNLGINKMKYDNERNLDLPRLAREIVADLDDSYSYDQTRIVWFNFTLGNWKALVVTLVPDGRYYEVTYHKEQSEIYVDVYQKMHQRVISVV